ncbi:MAG: DUF1080 domain-containing protein [Verrucomicrobia bacterium]|nr:DUF1080 domain-containing protein [Verrucomicrobiota bacterium]
MKAIKTLTGVAVAGLVLAAFSVQAAEKKKAGEGGWKTLFKDGLGDAKVVSGTATYKVENGVLVGTTVDGSPNSFLMVGPYKDFELEFEVNVDNELNSGVQVRSKVAKEDDPVLKGSKSGKKLPAGRMYGPQCEIAINGTAGDFYDEARRGVWWTDVTGTQAMRTDASKAAFKKGEWNKYRIVVRGDRYQSWVNGVPTADFRQGDDPEGYLGFQVHGIKKGTGPYSVRWRNVRVRELK